MVWQERVAAERFDDFYAAAVNQGRQTVARGGVEVAILVSIEEWHKANASSKNIKATTDSQEKH